MNRFLLTLAVCVVMYSNLHASVDTSIVIFPKNFVTDGKDNYKSIFDPEFTGKPIVTLSSDCVAYKAEYKDSIFNKGTSFQYCFQVLRKWTVSIKCYTDVAPKTAFQLISITDSYQPTFTLIPDLKIESNDKCEYIVNIKQAEALDKSGITNLSAFIHPTGNYLPRTDIIQFPYMLKIDSTQKNKSFSVTYVAVDACGNVMNVDKAIPIPDENLKIVCKNEVKKAFESSGEMILDPKEFLSYTFEKCASNPNLDYTVSTSNVLAKCFTGPEKINDTIRCMSSFNVRIVAKSKISNQTATCSSILLTSNPKNYKNVITCNSNLNAKINLCLDVKTAKGEPLSVKIDYEGDDVTSYGNGNFCKEYYDCPGNIWLNFNKDDNILNGVSTLDLVLISKHILGTQPFTTPQQLAAADVNGDGNISTADIILLRKAILGISKLFPTGESWRFLDENYKMKPMLMLSEYKSMTKKIIAVKLGDVNGDAKVN